jgi:hypothetical protein
MTNRPAVRLYTLASLMLTLLLVAAPARAQFRPRPISDPATGERYHIEGAAGFWFPTADMHVASTALGQLGTNIDFKNDLGLEDSKFPELHLVLRPAKSHKFRLQYIPLSYTQTATLTRNIIFNGQLYAVSLLVNSTLEWKAWRFGYEYDFITTDRGFAGLLLDVKYTNVSATLVPCVPSCASPLRSDFAQAQAPIPTIGGIFRAYPVANVSITGEVTGFSIGWLPKSLTKDNTGHFADVDFYATLNFTNNVGVQAGYRSFDVGYALKVDSGDFTLKGPYFGIVARY